MKQKASLVMLEQAVMLLVFALAAALCLRVFAWSETASRKSEARDEAMLQAQNAAELVSHFDGDLEAAAAVYGGSVADGVWQADVDDAFCLSAVSVETETPLLSGVEITVMDDTGECLAALTVYIQQEVAHE